MAIYRPPKPRWPAILVAALLGLVLGVTAGWLAFGRTEPDPEAALGRVRAAMTDAAATLEIVTIEYAESVEGTEVVGQTEYEGARSALARSKSRYEEFRSAILMLDRSSAERIDAAYEDLQELVEEPAPPEEIETAAEDLTTLLDSVVGEST